MPRSTKWTSSLAAIAAAKADGSPGESNHCNLVSSCILPLQAGIGGVARVEPCVLDKDILSLLYGYG